MKILLGYEIGSGRPVEIPLRHLAVTGQTQESGKTTTLEALISRSGLRAVAFVTKRAESGFRQAHRIPPYFREPAADEMWRFVAAVLEATLRERLKFQRPWIIQVCRGASSLAEVHQNVRRRLEKAKGIHESVLTELNAYLDIVLPQIERLPYSKRLELDPGINVMDLGRYRMELQSLVIRSVLEWLYQEEQESIAIIPEAWEFIPQQRGSPVLLAAEQLIRKGAAARNFVWLDSQDIAGVHKDVLRQVGVWILGVQREINEAKRTLAHIPTGSPKPKVQDIMTLERGQFFACFGREMVRVYVRPSWMPAEIARDIATGGTKLMDVVMPTPAPSSAEQEDAVWKEEAEKEKRLREQAEEELRDTKAQLQQVVKRVGDLERDLLAERKKKAPVTLPKPAEREPSPMMHPAGSLSIHETDALYQHFRARLLADPQVLAVLAQQPEIELKIERPRVQVDGASLKGRVALLIADGWLDQPRSTKDIFSEGRRRFNLPNPAAPRLAEAISELHTLGFLTRNDDGSYQTVPNMKRSIVR